MLGEEGVLVLLVVFFIFDFGVRGFFFFVNFLVVILEGIRLFLLLKCWL